MLNREAEEVLSDILAERINDANEKILEKIGESLKALNTIKPSQAHQLAQMLKFGGSYEEIAKILAKVSGKNVADIYKIFQQVARDNKAFAEEFYKYRGIDFIPYEKDLPLKNQVLALANLTRDTYKDIAESTIVGYVYKDASGQAQFKNLRDTYYDLIDRAVLNITQGKGTFDEGLTETLKQIGGSGIVTYQSGHTRRLDSAVRMNMQDSVRKFNQELTLQYGQQYGADGVEISVHEYPAPDHEDIQGRQFTLEEYEKLENKQPAKDVRGITYDGSEKRHIGEFNCYHRVFNIVVGVSSPLYTDRQLEQIREENQEGFELDGKHYTMYEGTQLQRRLETAIRQQKDTQILGRASGNNELIEESQNKIRLLNKKYNELCRVSGLKPKTRNMRVSGYSRTQTYKDYNPQKQADFEKIGRKQFNTPGSAELNEYVSQGNNIYTKMQRDVVYKEKMYNLAKDLDKLKTPVKENMVIYTAQDKDFDISKTDFTVSTTISKDIANFYRLNNRNREIKSIYVEKGANLISTYNTEKKQFAKQGELIIPISEIGNLEKITDTKYILRKKRK